MNPLFVMGHFCWKPEMNASLGQKHWKLWSCEHGALQTATKMGQLPSAWDVVTWQQRGAWPLVSVIWFLLSVSSFSRVSQMVWFCLLFSHPYAMENSLHMSTFPFRLFCHKNKITSILIRRTSASILSQPGFIIIIILHAFGYTQPAGKSFELECLSDLILPHSIKASMFIRPTNSPSLRIRMAIWTNYSSD